MKDRIQITVEDGMGHWDKLFNKIAENNISQIDNYNKI